MSGDSDKPETGDRRVPKMLSCSNCPGKRRLCAFEWGDNSGWQVLCYRCQMRGPKGKDKAEAVEFWNRLGRPEAAK